MMRALLDLSAVAGPYPSGPTRGAWRDWMAFQAGKTGQRVRRWMGQPRSRPHGRVLGNAVSCILELFDEPTCIETGCIRKAEEGTASTLAIAEALGGRGRFYTFELSQQHMETCQEVCKGWEDQINYIQGDAKQNLRRLRGTGVLAEIHLAFFDSADDPAQTLAEFEAVEALFVPGSLVIVDDAVRGVKGRLIKPLLHASPLWSTRVVHAGNGMLLATRRAE